MPPADFVPIRRMAIAVVDNRTTFICLHIAGMVVAVDEPFQTLAGDFDNPPFHISCRTQVQPWMAGMASDQRNRANTEARGRPAKDRRRQEYGFKGDRKHPPLSWEQKKAKGLPYDRRVRAGKSPTGVERRGSVGVQTAPSVRSLDEAVDLLKDPRYDITDIPVEFRRAAADASGRYTRTVNGDAGLNPSWWLEDNLTGKRWLLKQSNPRDARAEVLAYHLGDHLGVNVPRTFFAFDPTVDMHVFTLMEHVDDASWSTGTAVAGSMREIGLLSDEGKADLASGLLFDYLTNQVDRHPRNLMLFGDSAHPRVAWIDNAVMLRGQGLRTDPDGYFRALADFVDVRDYQRGLWRYMHITPEQLGQVVARFTRDPGMARFVATLPPDVLRMLTSEPEFFAAAMQAISRRLDYLVDHPDEVVEYVTGITG